MELPPGFYFVPSDTELIGYLDKKKCNHEDANIIIPEYDISKCNPDQIPRNFKYGLANESFYYTKTRPRHSKGQRRDRKAGTGSWRVTCGSRPIKNADGHVVGHKKKLVFLQHVEGRKRKKTEWMMDEYSHPDMNDYALCRIYCKAGHSKENRRVPTIPVDWNPAEEVTARSEVDVSESIGEIFNQSLFPQQSPTNPSLWENENLSVPGNNFYFGGEFALGPNLMQDCPSISTAFPSLHSTTSTVSDYLPNFEDSATDGFNENPDIFPYQWF